MTPEQIKQAEQDAATDAKVIGLLLLTAMASKSARELNQLEWKPDTGKFYIKGRSVSIKSIRNYLLSIENKLGRKVVKLVDLLEAKQITLAEFSRAFESTIMSSHILAGALAVGGIAVAVRNPAVQARIASEIKFADGLIRDIRKGKAGSFGRIKARAKSYFQAATITYNQVEQEIRLAIGIQTECKRVLRHAEHCGPCLTLAAKGWIAIEKMPPIGTLEPPKYPKGCGRFCRCFLIYR